MASRAANWGALLAVALALALLVGLVAQVQELKAQVQELRTQSKIEELKAQGQQQDAEAEVKLREVKTRMEVLEAQVQKVQAQTSDKIKTKVRIEMLEAQGERKTQTSEDTMLLQQREVEEFVARLDARIEVLERQVQEERKTQSSDTKTPDHAMQTVEVISTQKQANSSAFPVVPIGAVIDWWQSEAHLAVPPGYEVCDGGVVTTDHSPILGITKINLIGRFIKGVQWNSSDVNLPGGDANPSLNIDMDSAGDHLHNFAGDGSSGEWKVETTQTPSGNFWYSYTLSNGDHVHGASGTVEVDPPFVGLIKLLRVI